MDPQKPDPKALKKGSLSNTPANTPAKALDASDSDAPKMPPRQKLAISITLFVLTLVGVSAGLLGFFPSLVPIVTRPFTKLAHSSHGENSKESSHSDHQSGYQSRHDHEKGPTEQDRNNLFGRAAGAWARIEAKIEEMSKLKEENERLKIQYGRLLTQVESQDFQQKSSKAKENAHQRALELSHETGHQTGRTLASINYRPPNDLTPAELYNLALGYFKAQQNAKAAVILSHLFSQNDPSYRIGKNFLLAGVIWYRLKNYSLADSYFNEILKNYPDSGTDPQQHYGYSTLTSQARLWKAIVAKQLKKQVKTQFWMKELLDQNPHSLEASWINPLPSSKSKVDKPKVPKMPKMPEVPKMEDQPHAPHT